MSVTEADALSAGRERQLLAEEYRESLTKALGDHKAKRSLEEAIEDASVSNFVKTLQHLLLEPITLKFVTVLVGALIISLGVKIIQRSLGSYVQDSSSRYASRKVVTFVGYIITFVLAIVVFRDALGNLAVIVGAATAGIAFALKEVIVSLAGWFGVTFGDFYKVGDRIQLGGIKGDVIDVGFARTTLMELGEWVKGDLYTGRIVRVANSFIFTEPMFNYSGDFPFIWDEITIPIKYGSNHKLADEILKRVVTEVSADYVENAQTHWARIEKKYLVENARTEPMVTMVLNDNWIEFTVRYVVEIKRRRLTKDTLFRHILDEVNKTDGTVQFASATFHLVETPVIDVRLHKTAS
ncbi:MAG: mechanosensitive ion channel [Candidatus Competibacteraceae bacterium]|nr:mechanosensitive ion channel [Candidatus Competibacteraceae bacterium]